MAALPAITQVSYRGKLIAEGLIVHGELEAMRVLIPYAGGTLDPEGFTASTYVVRGAEGPTVDTLVIVREPALTPLEQKVLRQLPRELSQLSLGRGDLASAPGIVAGLLMADALEQRQRDLMQDQRDLMQEQELQRAQLDQLLRAQDLQRQLAQQELQRVQQAQQELQRVQQAQQELQRAQLDQLLRAQDLQRQLGQLQQQQLLLQQQQQQQADDQRRQQQQADEQRRQEQQRQQQEAEQRQREAQEQQRQESEARQARAAEADAADGDDGDDDDGGRRVFFDEDVLAAEVEGLEPGAAVSRLVELRTRLMLAGRLR
jgi:hypothetical protein